MNMNTPLKELLYSVTGTREIEFLQWFRLALHGLDRRCGVIIGGVPGTGKSTLLRLLKELYPGDFAVLPELTSVDDPICRGWIELPKTTRVATLDGSAPLTFDKNGPWPKRYPWLASEHVPGKAALIVTNVRMLVDLDALPGRRWGIFQGGDAALSPEVYAAVTGPLDAETRASWRAYLEGRAL